MREWYELAFTPHHAVYPMKHYDNVTDLTINGESIKTRDNRNYQRGKTEAINAYKTLLMKKLMFKDAETYRAILEIAEELTEETRSCSNCKWKGTDCWNAPIGKKCNDCIQWEWAEKGTK